MDARSPANPTGPEIGREELRAVIRHAAELYAAEAESEEERLSEAEVLRIAEELGLPARHVRRALYERPLRPLRRGLADRLAGRADVSISRIVENQPALALDRLEEYLTTREFLQVVRRQPDRIGLIPADDVISGVARRLRRPNGRYQLAHIERVRVSARPLDARRTHVRFDLDLHRRRRRLLVGSGLVGSLLGGTVGVAGVGLADAVLSGLGAGAGLGVMMGTGIAAGIGTSIAFARARLRRLRAGARLEIDGLLDRLQRGDRLEPPPAPWLRRLRAKLPVRGLPSR